MPHHGEPVRLIDTSTHARTTLPPPEAGAISVRVPAAGEQLEQTLTGLRGLTTADTLRRLLLWKGYRARLLRHDQLLWGASTSPYPIEIAVHHDQSQDGQILCRVHIGPVLPRKAMRFREFQEHGARHPGTLQSLLDWERTPDDIRLGLLLAGRRDRERRFWQCGHHGFLYDAAALLRRIRLRARGLPPFPPVRTYPEAAALLSTTDPGRLDPVAGTAALRGIDMLLSDDLHTPRALTLLTMYLRRRYLTDTDRAVLYAAAEHLLGLDLQPPKASGDE